MALTVPDQFVSPSVTARVALCGVQIRIHTESGAVKTAHWACGSKYCDYCERVYRAHVGACIAKALDAPGRADVRTNNNACSSLDKQTKAPIAQTFLTLTMPARGELTAADLRAAVDRCRAVWRRTTQRVRLYFAHMAKGDQVTAVGQVPPPKRGGGVNRKYAKTWRGVKWEESTAPYGYVWAREVTTGRHGTHWHVHVHVVTPDLVYAEMLNAAWQASCAELGVLPSGRWAHTDLREVDRHIARYLAKGPTAASNPEHAGNGLARYLAKSAQLEKIAPEARAVYVANARRMRCYDAGGACRPLGIRRPPPEDAVVAVEVWWFGGFRIVDAHDWYAARAPECAHILRYAPDSLWQIQPQPPPDVAQSA